MPVGAALLVGSFVLEPSPAYACGPTVDYVTTLLPMPEADGVPTDAALLAASNVKGMRFTLQPVPLGAVPDAGAPELPLEVTCHPGRQGELCVARVVDGLLPNTRYEWKAEVVGTYVSYGGGTPPGSEAPFGSFTTGEERATAPTTVTVALTMNQIFERSLCGTEASATFRVDVDEAGQGPLVFGFSKLTPLFGGNVQLFDPSTAPLELYLGNPPDCVTPEVFDAKGNRRELDEICLAEVVPPVLVDSSGQPVPAPVTPTEATSDMEAPAPPSAAEPEPDDSELQGVDTDPATGSSGCSLRAARGPGFGWLGLVSALALFRRRCRSRRP